MTELAATPIPDNGPFPAVIEVVGDGVLLLDPGFTVHSANPAARRLLGQAVALEGRRLDGLVRDSIDLVQLRREMTAEEGWRTLVLSPLAVAEPVRAELRRWPGCGWLMVLRPLTGGRPDALVAFATRDPITRLLNRAAFVERLDHAIAGAGLGRSVGLLVAEVDRFKRINEALGHAGGDAVLVSFAHTLRRAAPAGTVLGRISADQFGLLVEGAAEPRAELRVAAALLAGSLAGVKVAEAGRLLTSSMGLVVWPEDGANGEELLTAAETAVLAAKADGGNAVRGFDPRDLAAHRDQLSLEADLREALEAGGQLHLAYQPKVAWPARRLIGFEALLRWRHPARGNVRPDRFVPVAENAGLIVPLGRWVFAEACRQAAAWRDAGLAVPPVAINVSPQQLLAEPVERLLAPIGGYGLEPAQIEIEITETVLMDQLARTQPVLDALRRAGIRVAIDDFGTGHSSLAILRRLPLHSLKIDRSFVEDIDRCSEARDIIATIVAMARTLRLDVVAEGVETVSQAAFLERNGASVMQGYLFSPAVDAAEATRLLAGFQGGGPDHDVPTH